MVNIFSIPKYREINPALFTVVTFPIQFGIMFGDMGHGGLWLIIALFVFTNGKMLMKIGGGAAYENRYLILLMGFFATYCGSIYNEMFSIPFDLWGTCYKLYDTAVPDTSKPGKNLWSIARTEKCYYPYGMDPKWWITSNDLVFVNSFKMKWAVIFGVA
jgi:V-type H+-transporting ATPase subunit a